MSNPLDQLCELYGVLPCYSDIWGNARHTSEDAKRALLRAMGVAAATEEEISASLFAFSRRKWEHVLPPVQVVREWMRPYRIAVALPASEGKGAHRWRLCRESGAEDHDEFIPGSVEEVERYRFTAPGGFGSCDAFDNPAERGLVRRILVLDRAVEPGYHRLSIERSDGHGLAEMPFIVAPAICYWPPGI